MQELLRIDSFDNTIVFKEFANDLEIVVSTEFEHTTFCLSDEQAKKIIDTIQTFLINKIKNP